MSVKPIPEGYHTITPYLIVKGANDLVEFLKKAFNANIRFIMNGENDTVAHAELEIGDSVVMIAEAIENYEPTTSMLHLYVDNVDSLFKQAVNAGGIVVNEPTNQFYGDRSGAIKDMCGNQWWISTHVEDVSPEEMQRRQEEMKMQHK